jgi:hypothetical protein
MICPECKNGMYYDTNTNEFVCIKDGYTIQTEFENNDDNENLNYEPIYEKFDKSQYRKWSDLKLLLNELYRSYPYSLNMKQDIESIAKKYIKIRDRRLNPITIYAISIVILAEKSKSNNFTYEFNKILFNYFKEKR